MGGDQPDDQRQLDRGDEGDDGEADRQREAAPFLDIDDNGAVKRHSERKRGARRDDEPPCKIKPQRAGGEGRQDQPQRHDGSARRHDPAAAPAVHGMPGGK